MSVLGIVLGLAGSLLPHLFNKGKKGLQKAGSEKHRFQRAPGERKEGALGTKRKTLVEKATQASE